MNPQPDAESLAALYSDPESNEFSSDDYKPFENERDSIEGVLGELKRLRPTGHLMEVGCGRGNFLKMARDAGYTVEGCDYFGGIRPAIEGVPLHDGSLHDSKLPDASCDILVMRLTLEHVISPRDELAEIHRVLKPGGIFYVKVPNVRYEQGAGCRLLYGQSTAFGAPHHLNHFSSKTLDRMLESSGFTVRKPYLERPATRRSWKQNLPRQVFHLFARVLQISTYGILFPEVVISGTVRKRTAAAHT